MSDLPFRICIIPRAMFPAKIYRLYASACRLIGKAERSVMGTQGGQADVIILNVYRATLALC
jgi:hypothetical protein